MLRLHAELLARFGGLGGLRNAEAVKSALEQPFVSFDGKDLYPTLAEKASAVAFTLCKSHPFVDGNKRTAHAVMELFLLRNGYELDANPFETVEFFVDLANGARTRDELTGWIEEHKAPRRRR